MLRPMLSSRLSKLFLAALVAAFAIPAAASASMITYIDGKNVWVASPDGAIKRQLTTDGTTQVPYHVPSTDDHGNVAAVKGGLSNSKILVHLGADGKRTDNVLPWKISLGTNFGPSSARLSADGTKIAYTYLLNHGPYNGGIEPRMAIVTPKAPGHPTQPMIDQPGWEMPTWIDGKLVVAKNGVALLEMQPLQFTQFLQINDFKIVSTEISRAKGRYLIDMSRTADNARGLVLYSHTGAFPGGTLPAGCQVPTHGTPSFTHGLSPDGTQVTWKDDRGVMIGSFDPAQRDGAGWCQGTVRQISATGDEPTFGNATLSVPQDPPPPPPPVDDTPAAVVRPGPGRQGRHRDEAGPRPHRRPGRPRHRRRGARAHRPGDREVRVAARRPADRGDRSRRGHDERQARPQGPHARHRAQGGREGRPRVAQAQAHQDRAQARQAPEGQEGPAPDDVHPEGRWREAHDFGEGDAPVADPVLRGYPPKRRRQRPARRFAAFSTDPSTPLCSGRSAACGASIVSVTRRFVIVSTSGASTNRLPSFVATTMPSKMCSRRLSSTLLTVPSWAAVGGVDGRPARQDLVADLVLVLGHALL